jgi:hypothetical protein
VGGQRGVKLRQMRLGRLRCEKRVNAEGIGILLGVGQHTHRIKVGRFYSGDDALRHTCGTGSLVRGGAVGVKLCRIEVRVGVDEKWRGVSALLHLLFTKLIKVKTENGLQFDTDSNNKEWL